MIVVDASVLFEIVLQTESAATIEPCLLAEAGHLHAPHMIDLEVAQVVRRLTAAGVFSEERGRSGIQALAAFPIERHAHEEFLQRIWGLRRNLTPYDAAYVALAEALDAPLLTRDGRLARAPGHRARIELV